MNDNEIVELLLSKGYENGWAISEGKLVLWLHEEQPPKPLTKPDNA